MNESIFDVVVIGAGQSGVSASYFLKRQGIRHVVLEKGQVGESWHSQRWESFKMNTSNKLNVLPGLDYNGANPDGFGSAMDFSRLLKYYVSLFNLPVVENTRVVSVERNSPFGLIGIVGVRGHEELQIFCKSVVVASGDMNVKNNPLLAQSVSPHIVQLHSSEYKKAQLLPEGSVLVVGSGQSGCQIAEDLLDAGRKVVLASSAVPRVPRRYRGKDIMDWLIQTNFMDVAPEEVPDPKLLSLSAPLLSGVGVVGHTISLQFLKQRGVLVVGSLRSIKDNLLLFDRNANENSHFADGFSEMVKATIDEYIRKNSISAPAPQSDDADFPTPDVDIEFPIGELDLVENNVTAIIWATGFISDYSFINLPVFDLNGKLIHNKGEVSEDIFLLGHHWLRKRKSGLIYGVKEDAEYIINRVTESLSRKIAALPHEDASEPQRKKIIS